MNTMPPSVLVVDDDSNIRGVIGRALRKEGFAMIEAVDGLHAQEVIDSLEGSDVRVRVIVLDMNMPRADGITVLEHVRATQPHIPIVAMSGDPDQFERARAAGATIVLAKPFRLADLLEQVRQYCGDAPDVTGYVLVLGDLLAS